MSSNGALMRQELARLKAKQQTLTTEAKGLARDIAPLINPALHEIADMEVARAANMMDSLVVKQGEVISLQSRIWDLEEAIG